MKTPIILVLAVVAVACCAAVSSMNKPAPPYSPEQVKGNVRVVLLRVDRSTIFSDAGLSDAKAQTIHAIPGVSVVYVVELLGDEPVKHWNSVRTGKLAYANGKPVDSMPENIAGGGYGGSYEYEHYDWKALKQPAVTNPKRTHVFERFERGLRVPTGKVDLHFTAGFNGPNEEFVFENIPVD